MTRIQKSSIINKIIVLLFFIKFDLTKVKIKYKLIELGATLEGVA